MFHMKTKITILHRHKSHQLILCCQLSHLKCNLFQQSYQCHSQLLKTYRITQKKVFIKFHWDIGMLSSLQASPLFTVTNANNHCSIYVLSRALKMLITYKCLRLSEKHVSTHMTDIHLNYISVMQPKSHIATC